MQEKSKPVDNLRADAEKIITRAIAAVLPDAAVERALKGKTFLGRVYLVAAGKAAWQMAHAARACLQDNFCGGVVVTKYGHVKGEIANVACFEGGHPVPDENSLRGTDAALALTEDLTESDTVVFLLSGGGSALFEKPLLSLAELQDVTNQLLAAGADIVEINTIRKRLSAVKGGRFARHCAPAQVFAVVLSDILGDPLDMIASGPAYPDSSSCAQALDIAKRYGLRLSERAWALLAQETPKTLTNVETQITGSVRELCAAAAAACEALGYEPMILTDCLCCEAREAGSMLASIARTHARDGKNLAFLMGGVVSYTNIVKHRILGVPADMLEEYGAVSAPVARAMAEGARKATTADCAVSVTGVAGPDRDERGNPVGTVFIGFSSPKETIAERFDFGAASREEIRGEAADEAFKLLEEKLKEA